jgi:hypothetical protein
MSKSAGLHARIQRWGLWRTALYLLLRIGSDLLGIHVFVARARHTTDHFENPSRSPEIRFRRIEPDELDELTGDANLLLDEDFVAAARARGDIAFGAFDGARLVAYVWRSTTSAPHTEEVWVRAKPPYCYSYKSFAVHEYRGKRIVPGLVLYSDHVMRELGYTYRVGIIALSNFASLAMGPSLESKNIGHLGYLLWFGRPFFFRSRAVADIGLEMFRPADDA